MEKDPKQKIVNNRYDFVLLFDVTDGNPNGDPDGGNQPRVDPLTGEGLVTDVCIKRKVRNYVDYIHPIDRPQSYEIYVKDGPILKDKISTVDIKEVEDLMKDQLKGMKKEDKEPLLKRKAMMMTYYDIRTFGAVMSFAGTANAGQVRGPVQLTFGRSIDQVFPQDHTIVPVVAADKAQTMGRKTTITYGLYRMYGFVTPHFAEDTGFTEADLDLFWEALQRMFDVDHSAARGLMSAKGLYIFRHDCKFGNASAQELFEKVKVKSVSQYPRSFSDYKVTVDEEMPKGVTLIRELDPK